MSFPGFATELAALTGEYAPPHGALLLAFDIDVVLGCVGLRPLEWPGFAELKRLSVGPDGRGRQMGARLSQAALVFARDADYERVRLDTLPTMVSAQRLYEALGFCEIDAYRFNPVVGTKYMEPNLAAAVGRTVSA